MSLQTELETSASVPYIKFVLLYILRVFTKGFIHTLFACFIQHFIPNT